MPSQGILFDLEARKSLRRILSRGMTVWVCVVERNLMVMMRMGRRKNEGISKEVTAPIQAHTRAQR